MISCGSPFINVFKYNKIFISALTLGSVEINSESLVVERSRELDMTILNHRGGRVNLNSSLFKENKLPKEQTITGKLFGGGGMYILLGRYLSDPYHVYSPMQFQFINCTFHMNIAHTEHYDFLFTDVKGNPQEGYGRGGGVHVSIKNNLDDIHMTFLGCTVL